MTYNVRHDSSSDVSTPSVIPGRNVRSLLGAGDYHLDDLKVCRDGSLRGPLTAAPEVKCHLITAEDEFLLLACDGLWDVASSQAAVTFVGAKLRSHNDPERCAAELVRTLPPRPLPGLLWAADCRLAACLSAL